MPDVHELPDLYLIPFGLRLIVALAVFIVGRLIARLVLAGFNRVLNKTHVDVSLRKFLGDVVYAVLFVMVTLAALDSLGVHTTAIVAMFGALGLTVGLALQGTLSNFVAGVLLIVLRPYKIGDLVTIGKYIGRVDAIKGFQTILITTDNREITIPNAQIIAAPIENLTALGKRRIDLLVMIAQTIDLAKARALIAGALVDDRIQKDPAPVIEVAELSDASIKLAVRPWANVDDATALTTELMTRLKTALEGASVKFVVAVAPPSQTVPPMGTWPT